MVVVMFAGLLGVVLSLPFGGQTNVPTFASLVLLGGNLFALGASALLYVIRSRKEDLQPEPKRLPPHGVVWC